MSTENWQMTIISKTMEKTTLSANYSNIDKITNSFQVYFPFIFHSDNTNFCSILFKWMNADVISLDLQPNQFSYSLPIFSANISFVSSFIILTASLIDIIDLQKRITK